MKGRTVVRVYAVGDGGATGPHIGWATLVEPGYALMDPRPSPAAGPVRVVVLAGDGPDTDGAEITGAGVELFDATAQAVDTAPDLVVLELAGRSEAPFTPVPLADDPVLGFPPIEATPEEMIAGLRHLLADVPERPEAPPPPLFPPTEIEGLLERLRRLLHP